MGLKTIGVGIGGAVAGFVLEQSVNIYENNLQTESIDMRENAETNDSNNNIGVIATDK